MANRPQFQHKTGQPQGWPGGDGGLVGVVCLPVRGLLAKADDACNRVQDGII